METRGRGLERFPLQVEGPEGGDLNDKDGVGVRVGSERQKQDRDGKREKQDRVQRRGGKIGEHRDTARDRNSMFWAHCPEMQLLGGGPRPCLRASVGPFSRLLQAALGCARAKRWDEVWEADARLGGSGCTLSACTCLPLSKCPRPAWVTG